MAHIDDVVKRSPSSNCGFLVPEPFCCNSCQVSIIHMWNSCGDFCSWNDSVQIWNLTGVSCRLLSWIISFQKIIPVCISRSENFNGVDLLLLKKLLDESSMKAYFESWATFLCWRFRYQKWSYPSNQCQNKRCRRVFEG